MSDANRLLEIIERDIVAHGGDLGGWTRLSDESLQLFDGRVTLRAEVHEEEQAGDNVVHAHVFTTLPEHEDETGFDADLVHEVESVSTIAFGRLLFDQAVSVRGARPRRQRPDDGNCVGEAQRPGRARTIVW